MRTTRKDLDAMAAIINRVLDLTGSDREYFIQYAYGSPRLFRDSGAVEVSPRLPAGELALWMRAFIEGLTVRR